MEAVAAGLAPAANTLVGTAPARRAATAIAAVAPIAATIATIIASYGGCWTFSIAAILKRSTAAAKAAANTISAIGSAVRRRQTLAIAAATFVVVRPVRISIRCRRAAARCPMARRWGRTTAIRPARGCKRHPMAICPKAPLRRRLRIPRGTADRPASIGPITQTNKLPSQPRRLFCCAGSDGFCTAS